MKSIYVIFFHRNSHIRIKYKNLCNLISKTEKVLETNFNRRVEFVHLSFLIKRLYEMLSENERIDFVNRYPLNTNLHIWKVIGLKQLPNCCNSSLEILMSNACAMFKKMEHGIFSAADFAKTVLSSAEKKHVLFYIWFFSV